MEVIVLAAKAAAREVVDQMRPILLADIEAKFQQRFGDMTAAQHITSHTRLDKFFDRIDKLSEGFWSGIAASIAKGVGLLCLGGLIAYFGFKGLK